MSPEAYLCDAGSGIGVAVAFNAPIGGLLFAFEEVASWFATSLWWQTFFGCMLAVLALDTLRSAQRALTQGKLTAHIASLWDEGMQHQLHVF